MVLSITNMYIGNKEFINTAVDPLNVGITLNSFPKSVRIIQIQNLKCYDLKEQEFIDFPQRIHQETFK